ncbi:uncharacterized protein LOC125237505 [Leguminivora glycinivorella]|uniref:uncharacterized protein LOC125237505 n=1 Tax=Leguminivora glycinivorella TaxID=1035111 RepID=UPI00200D8975|nr:uncharacterized protein LOC125237505 [Leguminivora glycinivorella]
MDTQRTLHKHLHTNTHTNICQVNLQHCKDAMSELGQYVRRAKVEIALLQEPYAWRNRVAGLGHLGGALYYEGNETLSWWRPTSSMTKGRDARWRWRPAISRATQRHRQRNWKKRF